MRATSEPQAQHAGLLPARSNIDQRQRRRGRQLIRGTQDAPGGEVAWVVVVRQAELLARLLHHARNVRVAVDRDRREQVVLNLRSIHGQKRVSKHPNLHMRIRSHLVVEAARHPVPEHGPRAPVGRGDHLASATQHKAKTQARRACTKHWQNEGTCLPAQCISGGGCASSPA